MSQPHDGSKLTPLPVEALYHRCDPKALGFSTTDELEDLETVLGQNRAVAAIQFAIGMEHKGYNLFALGPAGIGKLDIVRRFLDPKARAQAPSSDWCYVNNFQDSEKPKALKLPTGTGTIFRDHLDQLMDDLKMAIPAAFESDEYTARRHTIEEEFKDKQQAIFGDIQKDAKKRSLTIMRTPVSLIILPERDGTVLDPDAIEKLPVEEQEEITKDVEHVQELLRNTLRGAPQLEKAQRKRLRDLNSDVTGVAVAALLTRLRVEYQGSPRILEHLDAIEEDIVDNVDHFLERIQRRQDMGGSELPSPLAALRTLFKEGDPFSSYRVNVLVDHTDSEGAPVVYEDNPTLANLVGRIDSQSQFGVLSTDFSLIRPGALHKANGGYLILDALRLLQQPFAYEQLKRALRSGIIRVETIPQLLAAGGSASLEPESIPLECKVFLLGEHRIYYLLSARDPEFAQLFKVPADFEVQMDRDGDTTKPYARLLAESIRREDLQPFTCEGVARIVEHSTQLTDDQQKLTTHLETLTDLLRESNYWAKQSMSDVVTDEHVQLAVDARFYRDSRIYDRLREQIVRGTILIDGSGEVVGQVNALSVLQIGNFRMGKPSRITAQVRLGKGGVIDIEREVKLGGPIHSKGVLILQGFLGARYAQNVPLALSASLVFEQSYGGVDGDSASLAELCTLLSAIAQVPIQQRFAVTGSINQHGDVQAVGGVNEKVAGFFDICRERGLTGDQGVILPKANAVHLMLHRRVRDAVVEGKFQVFAVDSVDEALELLLGVPAGTRDDTGSFPDGTINRLVEDRLAELAEMARAFGDKSEDSKRTQSSQQDDDEAPGDDDDLPKP